MTVDEVLTKIAEGLDDPEVQESITFAATSLAFSVSTKRHLRQLGPLLAKVRAGGALTYRESAQVVAAVGGLAYLGASNVRLGHLMGVKGFALSERRAQQRREKKEADRSVDDELRAVYGYARRPDQNDHERLTVPVALMEEAWGSSMDGDAKSLLHAMLVQGKRS